MRLEGKVIEIKASPQKASPVPSKGGEKQRGRGVGGFACMS